MSRRTALATAAAIAIALSVDFGNAIAQLPVRVGGEFQINTVTMHDQYGSKGTVALDADGDFVVVWSSYQQDDGLAGVFGQRYNSSGGARGVEFRINSHTVHAQNGAVVAADADGDFSWRGTAIRRTARASASSLVASTPRALRSPPSSR